MRASKNGKETLLIYIGWTRAHNFCEKKRKKTVQNLEGLLMIEIVAIK